MSITSFFIEKALAVTINPNIPGTSNTITNPGSIVGNFYQFALMIAGLLALGAIVYGGVKYAASAGNPSAQSDGKEWVLSALYGLLLLAGAYLILYTINPNLINLSIPVLSPLATNPTSPSPSPTSPTPPPDTCAPNGTCGSPTFCTGTCPANQTCTPGSANPGGQIPYSCVANSTTGFCSDVTGAAGQCTKAGTSCKQIAGHFSCVFTSPTASQCSGKANTCTYYGINATPPIPGCTGVGGVLDGGNAQCSSPPSNPNCYNVLVCP